MAAAEALKSAKQQIEALKSIGKLLKVHLSRLKTNVASESNYFFMIMRWDKLILPDVLAFSASAISQELMKSMQDGQHHYQSKRFNDIYVVVSTVPTLDRSKVKTSFKGGYFSFMDFIMNKSGFISGSFDLAHWTYCTDGKNYEVHLTFLPNRKLIRPLGPRLITVTANDLMTEAEKQMMGILSQGRITSI